MEVSEQAQSSHCRVNVKPGREADCYQQRDQLIGSEMKRIRHRNARQNSEKYSYIKLAMRGRQQPGCGRTAISAKRLQ